MRLARRRRRGLMGSARLWGDRKMAGPDRREAMLRLGTIAVLPLALGGHLAFAAENRPMRTAPMGEYRLSRKVSRSLVDGRMLTVERKWSCRFSASGRGFSVSSFDQSAKVDAPESLQALATMEEKRRDSGPFPALLDGSGMIVAARSTPTGASSDAIAAAMRALRNSTASHADVADARQFLHRLAGAAGAAMSAIPPDLFFPIPGEREDMRAIALPGGGSGTVAIALRSSAHEQSGLLDRFERSVQTRLKGDTRHSSEVWHLYRF